MFVKSDIIRNVGKGFLIDGDVIIYQSGKEVHKYNLEKRNKKRCTELK